MRVIPAGVMELVDVVDSKSTAGDSVPVRVRSPAPYRSEIRSTPFQGGPFLGGRLETVFRAFAPPFHLEPAALGFEVVLGA